MTTGRSGAGISDPVGAAGPASTAKVSRRLEWAAIITAGRSVPSPQAFAAWWRAQLALQTDRLVIWSPVAFGLGAAAYLGLHAEPAQWAGWLALAVATILAWLAWRFSGRHAVIVASMLAAVAALGFLVAKIHSDRVTAPIAPSRPGLVTVEGWVADIDTPSERGERLLIAPVRISGLSPAATPTRIRIVIGAPGGPEAAPPPGSAVRLLTLLDPPPGPAAPGAYDFARDAWFEGLGGVGLAMRQPDLIGLPAPPWRLRLEMAVNALRWSVAERLAHGVSAVLGAPDGGAGGLVAAVTTSHQDWLGAGHRDDLRGSGLAHMLAIAGLHTAAVSGFAFFAFRGLIAAWPWLALRTPGKKLAALGALVVVGAYLLLSGAHPPARRAAITAAVAFLAILADRYILEAGLIQRSADRGRNIRCLVGSGGAAHQSSDQGHGQYGQTQLKHFHISPFSLTPAAYRAGEGPKAKREKRYSAAGGVVLPVHSGSPWSRIPREE